MRIKLSLIAWFVVVSTSVLAQNFAPYEFSDAHLKLSFPNNPGPARVIKDLETGQVRKYIIKTKDGKIEYRAEVEFYKEKNVDREADNFFLAMLSSVAEKKSVTYGNKEMVQIKGGNKRKKAILCVFYEGNRVYRLSITSPGTYVSEDLATQFFGSYNQDDNLSENLNSNDSDAVIGDEQSGSKTEENNLDSYIEIMNEKFRIIQRINKNLSNVGQYAYSYVSFSKDITELEYKETLLLAEQYGNPENHFFEDDFDNFISFKTSFPMDFEMKFIPRLQEKLSYIQEIYAKRVEFPDNESLAISELEKIKPAIDACVVEFGNAEQIQNGKMDFYAVWDEIAAPLFKGLYLCDFHKENVGKIFFSNQPINPENITPDQFKNNFSINENIYGIVFLPKGIKHMGELSNENGASVLHLYTNMDNNNSYTDYILRVVENNELEENKGYILLDILPDSSTMSQNDAGKWMEKFARLSPRKHTFNISLENYQPGVGWASGMIEIDFTGMNKDQMASQAKALISAVEDKIAKNRQLPDYISASSAKFGSSMLSHSNIKTIIKRDWGDHIAEVLKIRITPNNDWVVSYDDYGNPENKINSNPIYIAYKGTDGKCYYIEESIWFVRDYEGNGKYSSNVRIWGHYDLQKIIRIACEIQ